MKAIGIDALLIDDNCEIQKKESTLIKAIFEIVFIVVKINELMI